MIVRPGRDHQARATHELHSAGWGSHTHPAQALFHAVQLPGRDACRRIGKHVFVLPRVPTDPHTSVKLCERARAHSAQRVRVCCAAYAAMVVMLPLQTFPSTGNKGFTRQVCGRGLRAWQHSEVHMWQESLECPSAGYRGITPAGFSGLCSRHRRLARSLHRTLPACARACSIPLLARSPAVISTRSSGACKPGVVVKQAPPGPITTNAVANQTHVPDT